MPRLNRIVVFPIKSLDGFELSSVEVQEGGALRHDRRWALVDSAGNFVNGKRFPSIHQIRATFSDNCQQVTLSIGKRQARFSLVDEPKAVARWCSEILGQECQLIENALIGFPDDREAPGPTLVSTSTLVEVSNWYKDLTLEETRRRFRSNLEIDTDVPFWEDRLVSDSGPPRKFRVGNTVWHATGVCQRCVVPTRGAHNGTVTAGFARQFSQRREATMPAWAPLGRFDHFYRLAINTQLESVLGDSLLRVGDPVEAIEGSSLVSHQ